MQESSAVSCRPWAVDGAHAFLFVRATVKVGNGRESCLVHSSLPPLPFRICPLCPGVRNVSPFACFY